MDFKFVVTIAIFFGINVILVLAAEKELNNPRIFTMSGRTQFRRHHHLVVDPAVPIKIDESTRNLLKKYLIFRSRQESEFLDTHMKKRDARPLSLQAAFVKVMRKNFIAMNVNYEGLLRAVQLSSVCFPLPKEDPGDALYFTNDLESEERFKKNYTHKIRMEQRVTLNDIEIQGLLMAEDGATDGRYNFQLSLTSPRIKAVYVRIPTKSQGIVTTSFSEVLTCEKITMNITQRGVILIKSVNVSQNMPLLGKIAEVWLVPVMEAIKTQRTFPEILYQSDAYFRKYIRYMLWRITDDALSVMNQLNIFEDSDLMDADNVGDVIKFLGFTSNNFLNFRASYYDSVPKAILEGSCTQYVFVHLFYMKFHSVATTNYPHVQYLGLKKVVENGVQTFDNVLSDQVRVTELGLKFEIDTDKVGVPLSMTKKYKVNLKLAIDDENPEKQVLLRMQEKLEKLMAEYCEEEMNNLIFGGTLTDE